MAVMVGKPRDTLSDIKSDLRMLKWAQAGTLVVELAILVMLLIP